MHADNSAFAMTQVRLVLMDASRLDREQNDEHRLIVSAYDSGQPPRRGQLDVTVLVLDANDNSPVFEYNAYEVSNYTPVSLISIVDSMQRQRAVAIKAELKTFRIHRHSFM